MNFLNLLKIVDILKIFLKIFENNEFIIFKMYYEL